MLLNRPPFRWSRKPIPGLAKLNWFHPLTRGLTNFWLLNENSTVVYDLVTGQSATANVGWVNTPASSSGVIGGTGTTTTGGIVFDRGIAATFNGTSQRITLPNTIALPSGFSLEMWIATYNVGGDQWWFTLTNAAGAGQKFGTHFGKFDIGTDVLRDTTVAFPDQLPITWHQGIFYQLSTTGVAGWYIDGKQGATGSSLGLPVITRGTYTPYIGFSPVTGDSPAYCNGQVLLVRIWNRPLALKEAEMLYTDPFVILTPPTTRSVFPLASSQVNKQQSSYLMVHV